MELVSLPMLKMQKVPRYRVQIQEQYELVDQQVQKGKKQVKKEDATETSSWNLSRALALISQTAGSRTNLRCQNPGCATCHMLAETCFPNLMQACRVLFPELFLSSSEELQWDRSRALQ